MGSIGGVSDAAQLVREFLDLLVQKRAEEAIALIDPDIEWRNSGYPTIRGKRVAAALRSMERRGIHFSADMHHMATDDTDPGVVLTERTDHLGYGRFTASFWVCGTFAVREGRIVLWDDHFSTGNVLLASLRGAAGMLRTSRA